MDPELMKMAMESMSKMTPQQMTDMQRQMAQLQPDFLRSQMAAMQNIPPDVLRQRMAAASTLDPSQMQAQFSQAATAARQQEEHQIRCSNQLKEEGNRLFGAQRTDEAIEKYRRAKDNLKDLTSSSARDVRLKCALNLASCHLRLGEHADAVRECSEVLEAQPGDRKALYRRGQAHLALQEYGSAVTDLQKALVSATDADRDVIKEKLAKAEEGLAAEGDASKAAGALPDAQKAESSKAGAEVVEEDGAVSEVAPIVEPIQANYAQPPPREPMQPSFPAGFPGSMPSFPANSGMPNLDPRMMREMMGMIRKNPGMMESMLSAVTPEQLQAAAQMNGGLPPGVDLSPEVMRSMANSMAAMPQEQMDSMLAAVHASRAPAPSSVSGSTPADETAGPSVGFPAGPGSSQADLAAAAMQMNPEMMSQAMDMFTKMDPDVLANMARSMGGAPGPGTQASAGLDMPQNAAAMQQMLNNPQAVKMMHSMMSSMSPEQLAAMSKASGHELSPEQAEVMASKMQNMSEQQVQQLLKAASWLQRAVDLARKARDVTLANKLFVLGVVVLLLALLLRRMGIV